MSRRLVPLACFAVGLAVILSGSVPTVNGQPKPLVVPVAPQSPTLTSPANLGAKPGGTVELVLTGTNLTDPASVLLSCAATGTVVEDKKPDAAKVKVKIDVPATTPIGLYTIRVSTKHGVSNLRPFVVDDLPEIGELETNRTKSQGHRDYLGTHHNSIQYRIEYLLYPDKENKKHTPFHSRYHHFQTM